MQNDFNKNGKYETKFLSQKDSKVLNNDKFENVRFYKIQNYFNFNGEKSKKSLQKFFLFWTTFGFDIWKNLHGQNPEKNGSDEIIFVLQKNGMKSFIHKR